MIAPTHLIGGQFAYLVAAWATGHPPHFGEALLAAGAAMLPDLDKREGVIGRRVPWLSGPLEHAVGHRTATHSLAATVALAALLYLLPVPGGIALALLAGFASHPVLDMMTPSGVAWFWPARARCVLPGDTRWRMEAMGKGEMAFAGLLALLSWPTLAAAEAEVGILGTVRDAIGDVAQARRHYDAHKSEAAWWLELAAEDNARFQPVEGRFRVIGPYRANGLLVETPEGPRSVCKAEACDWYAESAVIQRGEAQRTTTRHLATESTEIAALVDALGPLQEAGRVYLLGDLEGDGFTPDPPTVEGTGQGVRLRYADPAALRELGGQVEGADLLIQVRHEPGAEVPEPGTVESEPAGIDPRLGRYVR